MYRWGLSLLVIVLLISPGYADPFVPLHLHLVCPANGCPDEEGRAAFERWRQEALHAPGSTFVRWSVDPARPPTAVVAVCVPSTGWGANVMAAKAHFLAAARAAVSSTTTPVAVPPQCISPDVQAPGRHQLHVAAALSPLPPAVWQRFPAALPRPLHLAVLCDRSLSHGGRRVCTPTALVEAFDYWLAESTAALGASFALYEVGTLRQPPAAVFTATVPERSLGERVAWLLHVRQSLVQTLSGTPANEASALAEAIHAVGPALRERPGRHRIVLITDLRQYTAGELNFEKGVPAVPVFLGWLRRKQLLPFLREVEVLTCGADYQPGLRDAWSAAFQAMQATELGIFQECPVALTVAVHPTGTQ